MVEHLSIRQIKKELRDLYDELDLYLKKKKLLKKIFSIIIN